MSHWDSPGPAGESGDVECQGQLVWWSNDIEQSLKCRAQISDRRFLRRSVADSADARAELGGRAPNTVLVLLNDVGHVYDTSHQTIMP
jgi:hypothetical protein